MKRSAVFGASLLLSWSACGGGGSGAGPDAASPDAAAPSWQAGTALPEALANNAVASVQDAAGCTLYSALGIDSTLAAAGITRRAYSWRDGEASWKALPDVPGTVGRVAAAAVVLRGKLYVLGGYSVGPGTRETSFDAVDVYDPIANSWSSGPPMPIAIDDQVAVVWRDRWIVVVTGWSNTRSVDAVQIYDADSDRWTMATAFPGTPVFGPAGAIVGDTLLVVDGVASSAGFPIVNQAWKGVLDPDDPTTIRWTDVGPHAGPARYRAAGGAGTDGAMWFHGGTSDPYNYDGLSYDDGQPSPPLDTTLRYDIGTNSFDERVVVKPTATMDHRSLASCSDAVYSVGGMVAGPAATAQTWRFVF